MGCDCRISPTYFLLPRTQVLSVYMDCDRDSIIFLSDPIGPACHTNAPTCYFKEVEVGGARVAAWFVFCILCILQVVFTITHQRAHLPLRGGEGGCSQRGCISLFGHVLRVRLELPHLLTKGSFLLAGGQSPGTWLCVHQPETSRNAHAREMVRRAAKPTRTNLLGCLPAAPPAQVKEDRLLQAGSHTSGEHAPLTTLFALERTIQQRREAMAANAGVGRGAWAMGMGRRASSEAGCDGALSAAVVAAHAQG